MAAMEGEEATFQRCGCWQVVHARSGNTNGDLKGAVVYEPIMKVEGHMSKMSRELGERSWGAANQEKGQGAREPA